MLQGRRMVTGHKGMRKGISLVEMFIAIVLFGVLAVISFKYVKTFYNVNLATKQARVAALIEQGAQLSGAYDIYVQRFGASPTSLAVLSDANVSILTGTPSSIAEIGTGGWQYKFENIDLSSGGVGATGTGSDTAYYFDTAGSTDDYAEYCAVINNFSNPSVDLNTTDFPSTTFNIANYSDMYCVGIGDAAGNGAFRIVFVK